jgi:hypothetical protein
MGVATDVQRTASSPSHQTAAQSGAAPAAHCLALFKCKTNPHMPGVLGLAHHQLLPPPPSPAHSQAGQTK